MKQTREESRAESAEIAYREAREQGLPEMCEDPAVYELLGRMLSRDRHPSNRKAAS